jgi:hypothetical protein
MKDVVLKSGSEGSSLVTLAFEVAVVQVGVGSSGLNKTLDLVFNTLLLGSRRTLEVVEGGDEVELNGLALLEGVELLSDVLDDKRSSVAGDLVLEVGDEVVVVFESVEDESLRNVAGKSVPLELVLEVVEQVLASADLSWKVVHLTGELRGVVLAILEGQFVLRMTLEGIETLAKVVLGILEVG